MRDLGILFVHLIVTLARLAGPGGIRSVVAESVLVKQQLLVLNRSRQRSPNLRTSDRLVAGLCALLIRPARLIRSAIVLKPSTLLNFHQVMRNAGTVNGVALCRMFNYAIQWQPWMPKYLSSDHDPLYRFGQWQANLRILEVTEIKTVPYVPLSHPFVERLIGTANGHFRRNHSLFELVSAARLADLIVSLLPGALRQCALASLGLRSRVESLNISIRQGQVLPRQNARWHHPVLSKNSTGP